MLGPDGRGEIDFNGFDYHDYDPQLCFNGKVDYNVDEISLEIEISEGTLRCRRIGVARFPQGGATAALDVYWLDIYGGGLWLPVGDETNGTTSYSGGRYLFDTAKGANLGLSAEGRRDPARFQLPLLAFLRAQRFMELPAMSPRR